MKISDHDLIVMVLGCYCVPLELNYLHKVVTHLLKIPITPENLELMMNDSDDVLYDHRGFMIEDRIMAEHYMLHLYRHFPDIFDTLYDEVTPTRRSDHNDYYSLALNDPMTRIRLKLYLHRGGEMIYHDDDHYREYLKFVKKMLLSERIDYSVHPHFVINILTGEINHKMGHWIDVTEDIAFLQQQRMFWKTLMRSEKGYLYGYYLLMTGKLMALREMIENGGQNSLIFQGMVEMITGRTEEALVRFNELVTGFVRRREPLSECYQVVAGLVALIALIRHPEKYSKLHREWFHPLSIRPVDSTPMIALYHQKMVDQTVADPVGYVFVPGSIIGMVDVMAHTTLSVVEQWGVDQIFQLGSVAMSGGYYWIALEFFYLLNQHPDRGRHHVSTYEVLSKRLTGVKPIATLIPIKEGRAVMGSLIEDDLQQRGAQRERIIWKWIGSGTDRGKVQPYHQRVLKNGGWRSGKAISPETLSREYLILSTGGDLAIAKRCNTNYAIPILDLIPYLGGVNNIYHDDDLEHPIYFESARYPVTIYDSENGFDVVTTSENRVNEQLNRGNLFKVDRYHYRAVTLGESTLKLLRQIENGGVVFTRSEEDLEQLNRWIEENKTLELNTPFYHPPEITPQKLTPVYGLLLELDRRGDQFYIHPKLRPFPGWKPYDIDAPGITIVRKNGANYQKIIRDRDAEVEFIKPLMGFLKLINPEIGKWIVINTLEEMVAILDRGATLKTVSWRWWGKGPKRKTMRSGSRGNLRVKIIEKNSWFQLNTVLQFDDEEQIYLGEYITEQGIPPFITLRNGEIIFINRQIRADIKKIAASSVVQDGETLLPATMLHQVADLLTPDQLQGREGWRDKLTQLNKIGVKETELPKDLEDRLRDYQKVGTRWIIERSDLGFGVCLADDMGLGKTIQTIAAMAMRPGAALIITPASVLYNWRVEMGKFAPNIRVHLYEGKYRSAILNRVTDHSAVVVSYDTFQRDADDFYKKEWQWIILDEAQMIKNPKTGRSKAIFKLKGGRRVALSGTPIENHLGELWSLYHFLNSPLLGDHKSFNNLFVKPILNGDQGRKKILTNLLSPFLLRRLKEDVLAELPDKTEQICWVDFAGREKSYYEALRRDALRSLSQHDPDEIAGRKRIKILAHLTKLRQAACDISLVGEEIEESGKTLEAFNLIEKIMKSGHKVLVFSQFRSYLNRFQEYLSKKEIKTLYLNGSVIKQKRQMMVDRFQNGDISVFLISLKAGGTGLNLTAANYVIHMDPWWNPAVEDQATDRTHRIGQSKHVTVYKLIARDSIEEKIIKLHDAKRNLSNTILDGMDQPKQTFSIDDLMALLQ